MFRMFNWILLVRRIFLNRQIFFCCFCVAVQFVYGKFSSATNSAHTVYPYIVGYNHQRQRWWWSYRDTQSNTLLFIIFFCSFHITFVVIPFISFPLFAILLQCLQWRERKWMREPIGWAAFTILESEFFAEWKCLEWFRKKWKIIFRFGRIKKRFIFM